MCSNDHPSLDKSNIYSSHRNSDICQKWMVAPFLPQMFQFCHLILRKKPSRAEEPCRCHHWFISNFRISPPTGHDKNMVKMTPFIRKKPIRSGILRFQILRQTPIMLFGALDPSSLSLPRLLAEPGVENGAAEGGTLFNASKSGEIICQPRQRWSKCTSYTVHSYIIDIDAVKALHEDPRSKKEINMEKKGLERSNAFHKPRFTPEP